MCVVIRSWVWLECIGVVSGCCCKELYRFPHNITYPYSTCISSFLQQHPYFFVHLKNDFHSIFSLYISTFFLRYCLLLQLTAEVPFSC